MEGDCLHTTTLERLLLGGSREHLNVTSIINHPARTISFQVVLRKRVVSASLLLFVIIVVVVVVVIYSIGYYTQERHWKA